MVLSFHKWWYDWLITSYNWYFGPELWIQLLKKSLTFHLPNWDRQLEGSLLRGLPGRWGFSVPASGWPSLSNNVFFCHGQKVSLDTTLGVGDSHLSFNRELHQDFQCGMDDLPNMQCFDHGTYGMCRMHKNTLVHPRNLKRPRDLMSDQSQIEVMWTHFIGNTSLMWLQHNACYNTFLLPIASRLLTYKSR